MSSAPIIETERLILRPHVRHDLEVLWAFYQSNRAQYLAAPKTPSEHWTGFLAELGSWEVFGHGSLAITLPDDQMIGQVCISQPPHFPELELAWIIFDGFEGKGFAFEAASAMRDFAFEVLGVPTLVSYVDRANARSIALAQRLGAEHDPEARSYDPDDLVYRHKPDSSGPGLEAYA